MEIVRALPEDEPAIVALFAQYHFALERQEWLRWKYRDNPYGGALSYKIVQDERIVGAAALLPRLWHHQGRRLIGLQLVDGLMGKEIRGKHLFQELTAFLMRQPPERPEQGHFYLTLPSVPASVKACANAGLHPLASFDLFTHVTDPGALGRVRGLAWLAPLARPLWRAAGRVALGSLARGVTVEEVHRFDQDLTWLFPHDRVHGDRSAVFLNWRVFDNPQSKLRAFFVRDRGELAGYVIVREAGKSLEVMDLKFVAPRPRFLAAFLRHVQAQRLGETVDCGLLPGHVYRPLLRRLGFWRRGTGHGVFYVHQHVAAGLPDDPAAWDVNYLDSDW